MEGKQLFLPAINDIYADGGYTGNKFASEIKKRTNRTLRIIKRPQRQGFKLLARRWIVERTFAWLNKSRRLSKDYELSVQSSEGFIHLAIRLMLRRLIN